MGLFDIFKKKKKEKVKPAKKTAFPVKEKKPKKLEEKPKEEKPKEEKKQVKPVKKVEEIRPRLVDQGRASKILIRPVITEKASSSGELNKYVFEVPLAANKAEIKKAVDELYGFRPIKINIIPVQGKDVRYGRTRGRTRDWKKAIITLKQGDRIELYETK